MKTIEQLTAAVERARRAYEKTFDGGYSCDQESEAAKRLVDALDDLVEAQTRPLAWAATNEDLCGVLDAVDQARADFEDAGGVPDEVSAAYALIDRYGEMFTFVLDLLVPPRSAADHELSDERAQQVHEQVWEIHRLLSEYRVKPAGVGAERLVRVLRIANGGKPRQSDLAPVHDALVAARHHATH